jgi:hypothetical protein
MNAPPWPAWDGVRPLDWYLLMHQAETIRDRHHLGLASVWRWINRRDYPHARTEMDRVISAIKTGEWETPPVGINERRR